jgi:hypothetical protein
MTMEWRLGQYNWIADVTGLGRYTIRFDPEGARYGLRLNGEWIGSFLGIAEAQERARKGAEFHERESQSPLDDAAHTGLASDL